MNANEPTTPKPRRPRGFAAMSPEKQREIAGKGGRAAAALGVGHRWTKEEASAAGSKSGRTRGANLRARRGTPP